MLIENSQIMNNTIIYAGSFEATNNQDSYVDITGLLFPTSNYRSFWIQLSMDVIASGSLYQQAIIEGIQDSTGWHMYVSHLGDTIDFNFDITEAGQIQYSAPTNYPGWVSTTLNYQVNAIAIGGGNAPITLATTGNQTITGGLAITSTQNATDTSTGALAVSGGIACAGDLRVGGKIYYSVNDYVSASFSAANDVATPTNVTGLAFDNATYRTFNLQLAVSVNATTQLYQQVTIDAVQTAAGWQLFVSEVGDVLDIEFNITNTGQVQYTSLNFAGWVSTTIKWQGNAIKI
jgi:hypothetical protein